MSKLVWDKPGEHYYETGVSKGVLYVASKETDAVNGYAPGVVWNGLTTVSENPTGAEVTKIYADNINYLNLMSLEEFEASITAYTYPEAFAPCDGSINLMGLHISQQARQRFCFCYQTKVGNDEDSELGYKIHVVYGCLASPSERSYETVNDSPDAIEFSWDLTTTPVEVVIGGVTYKPTAHIELDSTEFKTEEGKAKLQAIENALYGSDSSTSHVLMPAEIYNILAGNVKLATPVVTLTTDTIGWTAVQNAENYIIFSDGEQIASTVGEAFDLSTVLTAEGEYEITVKATASGYLDSKESVAVTYEVN